MPLFPIVRALLPLAAIGVDDNRVEKAEPSTETPPK
jgi:hypothetical protein